MKISKKVREEAARLCSLAACNPTALFIWERSGAGHDAQRLAGDAFMDAPRRFGSSAAAWAEAEAMLRTGWSPK